MGDDNAQHHYGANYIAPSDLAPAVLELASHLKSKAHADSAAIGRS